MSDVTTKTRKPRAAINALKVLNSLRGEKGLPKIRIRPANSKKPGLSRDDKAKLCRTIWAELYPQATTQNDYALPEGAAAAVLREFIKRTK